MKFQEHIRDRAYFWDHTLEYLGYRALNVAGGISAACSLCTSNIIKSNLEMEKHLAWNPTILLFWLLDCFIRSFSLRFLLCGPSLP